MGSIPASWSFFPIFPCLVVYAPTMAPCPNHPRPIFPVPFYSPRLTSSFRATTYVATYPLSSSPSVRILVIGGLGGFTLGRRSTS
ncbi:hypothetical protein B0J17DRAFT_649620 [Rhizoctonia solani]|nr:hypothetical protein B0J17DRAFT_649620 [Rhizoctonia solani]